MAALFVPSWFIWHNPCSTCPVRIFPLTLDPVCTRYLNLSHPCPPHRSPWYTCCIPPIHILLEVIDLASRYSLGEAFRILAFPWGLHSDHSLLTVLPSLGHTPALYDSEPASWRWCFSVDNICHSLVNAISSLTVSYIHISWSPHCCNRIHDNNLNGEKVYHCLRV